MKYQTLKRIRDMSVLSAQLRVFLQSDINEVTNRWTSVNGWRNVDLEVLSKEQFERFRDAVGGDEIVRNMNCELIRETIKRYDANQLTDEEYKEC